MCCQYLLPGVSFLCLAYTRLRCFAKGTERWESFLVQFSFPSGFECMWVRIKGRTGLGDDNTLGGCSRPPDQVEQADEALFR